MSKYVALLSFSALLIFSSLSAFAEQSQRNSQGEQSTDPAMQGNQNMGSSIESKSPSNAGIEPEPTKKQKEAAIPGGVGEEGSTFGSPSTFPPGETSQGYTGEDKKAEEREKRQQGM
ncbi:MAG: hypothetical protein NPIRA06_33220 [Nitrospirales bacterium]|nr:MAG: hypothetical protein NPIRA06_33220 [Nitrospirales bacterium]